MDDSKKALTKKETDVSRRNFITKAVAGAGATAAVMMAKSEARAAATENAIKIPDTFAAAAKVEDVSHQTIAALLAADPRRLA